MLIAVGQKCTVFQIDFEPILQLKWDVHLIGAVLSLKTYIAASL